MLLQVFGEVHLVLEVVSEGGNLAVNGVVNRHPGVVKVLHRDWDVLEAVGVKQPGSCQSNGDASPQTPLHVPLSQCLCGVLHWTKLHVNVCLYHLSSNWT